jgi:hypothetical protein
MVKLIFFKKNWSLLAAPSRCAAVSAATRPASTAWSSSAAAARRTIRDPVVQALFSHDAVFAL